MRWVFIILTSRSFFVGESSPRDLGTRVIRTSSDALSSNDTSQKDVTGLNQSHKQGTSVSSVQARSPAFEQPLPTIACRVLVYWGVRLVYWVVRLREDYIQLPTSGATAASTSLSHNCNPRVQTASESARAFGQLAYVAYGVGRLPHAVRYYSCCISYFEMLGAETVQASRGNLQLSHMIPPGHPSAWSDASVPALGTLNCPQMLQFRTRRSQQAENLSRYFILNGETRPSVVG
jgi:hypothetical protein